MARPADQSRGLDSVARPLARSRKCRRLPWTGRCGHSATRSVPDRCSARVITASLKAGYGLEIRQSSVSHQSRAEFFGSRRAPHTFDHGFSAQSNTSGCPGAPGGGVRAGNNSEGHELYSIGMSAMLTSHNGRNFENANHRSLQQMECNVSFWNSTMSKATPKVNICQKKYDKGMGRILPNSGQEWTQWYRGFEPARITARGPGIGRTALAHTVERARRKNYDL